MKVIFSKIKAKNKKSVKKSSQTILALNCGRRATAYTTSYKSSMNGEYFQRRDLQKEQHFIKFFILTKH